MNAYLDILAMICTGGSTWLFACGRSKLAYKALIVGSVLWTGVALMGSFEGRPIYGMLIGSANTFIASVLALRWARNRVVIDEEHIAAMNAELEGYQHFTPSASSEQPDTRGRDSSAESAPSPGAHPRSRSSA